MSENKYSYKDAVAKLLANEGIKVIHRNTETANFDLESRTITLPPWGVSDKDVYDVFVGHEVGHALFTPKKYISVKQHHEKLKHCPDILNVVEDARIERLIKNRYKGLRKSFINGYKKLSKQLIKIDYVNDNADKSNFLDRINVYFKFGKFNIYFSPEERAIIERMSVPFSFTQAVKISEDIYDMIDKQQNGESEKGQQKEKQDDDSSNEGNSGNSNETGDLEDDEESKSGKSQSPDENDDSEGKTDKKHSDSKPHIESEVQKAIDEYKASVVDVGFLSYVDVYMPRYINCNDYILAYKNIKGCLKSEWKYNKELSYTTFLKNTRKEISFLANLFMMKKKSEEYKKKRIYKTGTINTNKLYSYKYDENIFKVNEIENSGNKYGMVMLLDWSVSMQRKLYHTIKQTVFMCLFCKMVNIPFEVYSFTDKSSYWNKTTGKIRQSNSGNTIMPNSDTQFINWLSYKQTNREFSDSCNILFSYSMNGGYAYDDKFEMGNTPLYSSLIIMNQLLHDFKKSTKVDIVNFIVLTDGDDTRGYQITPQAKNSRPMLKSELTSKRYFRDQYNNGATMFLDYIKDHHNNINLIGFDIGRDSDFQKMEKSNGYDVHYKIPTSHLNFNNDDSVLSEPLDKIKSAGKNKIFLRSFIENIV